MISKCIYWNRPPWLFYYPGKTVAELRRTRGSFRCSHIAWFCNRIKNIFFNVNIRAHTHYTHIYAYSAAVIFWWTFFSAAVEISINNAVTLVRIQNGKRCWWVTLSSMTTLRVRREHTPAPVPLLLCMWDRRNLCLVSIDLNLKSPRGTVQLSPAVKCNAKKSNQICQCESSNRHQRSV